MLSLVCGSDDALYPSKTLTKGFFGTVAEGRTNVLALFGEMNSGCSSRSNKKGHEQGYVVATAIALFYGLPTTACPEGTVVVSQSQGRRSLQKSSMLMLLKALHVCLSPSSIRLALALGLSCSAHYFPQKLWEQAGSRCTSRQLCSHTSDT